MSSPSSGSSSYDQLTGLPNADGLELLAAHMLARAQRNDERISLVCFDVVVPEAVGSDAAERATAAVLGELSCFLRDNLRASDVVARTRFDELVILLPDTDAEQVESLSAQLGSVAAREGLITHHGAEVEMGTSTFEPRSRSCDLQVMLQEAHLAISLHGLRWR